MAKVSLRCRLRAGRRRGVATALPVLAVLAANLVSAAWPAGAPRALDCAHASSFSDRLTCSRSSLRTRHAAMEQAEAALRERLDAPGREQLRMAQEAWRASIDHECTRGTRYRNEVCLDGGFEHRRWELEHGRIYPGYDPTFPATRQLPTVFHVRMDSEGGCWIVVRMPELPEPGPRAAFAAAMRGAALPPVETCPTTRRRRSFEDGQATLFYQASYEVTLYTSRLVSVKFLLRHYTATHDRNWDQSVLVDPRDGRVLRLGDILDLARAMPTLVRLCRQHALESPPQGVQPPADLDARIRQIASDARNWWFEDRPVVGRNAVIELTDGTDSSLRALVGGMPCRVPRTALVPYLPPDTPWQ